MSDQRLCILVLNWMGATDTIECLISLSKVSYKQADIVVIDNGSTDDSVAQIRQAHPKVKIIELPENLLFGGGNNAGLDWAIEQQYDFVMFINNDTLVEPDFLEPLVEALDSDSTLGMVGPLICYADKPETIWYGGGLVDLWNGIIAHRYIRQQMQAAGNTPIETDYITGCCLMMPVAVAEQLQGFDPYFTMYGEDVDLSLRCRARGYSLGFIPESKMYHKVSASMGGEFSIPKLQRKALGILKVYARHANWYQWPSILAHQSIQSVKYAYVYWQQTSTQSKKA